MTKVFWYDEVYTDAVKIKNDMCFHLKKSCTHRMWVIIPLDYIDSLLGVGKSYQTVFWLAHMWVEAVAIC